MTAVVHPETINSVKVTVHAAPSGDREHATLKAEAWELKVDEHLIINGELDLSPLDREMGSVPSPIIKVWEGGPALRELLTYRT